MAGPLKSTELGRLGEQLAEEHLVQMGYQILARNWRWPKGELDLVAQQRGEIVFVEVKARRSQTFGPPEGSITQTKREKLIQTAYAYLGSTARQDVQWRIDVVAIDMNRAGEVIRLEHIVSAVEGG